MRLDFDPAIRERMITPFAMRDRAKCGIPAHVIYIYAALPKAGTWGKAASVRNLEAGYLFPLCTRMIRRYGFKLFLTS